MILDSLELFSWQFFIYVLLCWLIDVYAISKGRAKYFYGFISIWLTPFIGLIIVFFLKKIEKEESTVIDVEVDIDLKGLSNADKILKLSALLDKGLITEEEFLSYKKDLKI